MWIFTQKGFLSIVRHSDRSGVLIVRSRFSNHIQSIFPSAQVSEDAGTDYRYRTELSTMEVSKTIARMVSKIDYDNFKASLEADDQGYFESCVEVYSVVARNSGDWDLENFIYGRRKTDEKK